VKSVEASGICLSGVTPLIVIPTSDLKRFEETGWGAVALDCEDGRVMLLPSCSTGKTCG